MKSISGVVLALGLLVLSGCDELVRSDAQLAADTQKSSVDVVGDPADATPDSDAQADILGADRRGSEDSMQLTETRDTDLPVDDNSREPAETDSEPDVVGGLGQATPVSLKSKKVEVKPAKQVKP